MKYDYNGEILDLKNRLPVIPLRDVVIFPHMMYPLLIGREFTINALHQAMDTDKQVLLVAQRQAGIDHPDIKDLHRMGVIARVLQVTRMPNGTLKVLVEGITRAEVLSFIRSDSNLTAEVQIILPDTQPVDRETEALFRTVSERFAEYVRLNRRVPDEVAVSVASIERYDQQTDTIAAHVLHKVDTKQKLLEATTLKELLHLLANILKEEIE
ncbi:MAG: LON peptidase substrate-binding domain-containing protein, partial [Candidatus Zixiibacteriota bacterium]